MKTKPSGILPEYGLLTLAMELRDRLNDWDRQDEELADALSSLDASERDGYAEENTRLAILAKRSAVISSLLGKEKVPSIIPPNGDKGKKSLPLAVQYGGCFPSVGIPETSPTHKGAGAALDWYNDHLQLVVDSADAEDPALHVRYNDEGSIVEIIVADALMDRVKRESGPTTPWQQERDAEKESPQ